MNQLLREEGKRRTDSVPTSILVVFLWMVVMLCSSSVREKVLFVVRLVGFDDDDIWLVGQRVRLVGSVSSDRGGGGKGGGGVALAALSMRMK
jgi:hypothetical protein